MGSKFGVKNRTVHNAETTSTTSNPTQLNNVHVIRNHKEQLEAMGMSRSRKPKDLRDFDSINPCLRWRGGAPCQLCRTRFTVSSTNDTGPFNRLENTPVLYGYPGTASNLPLPFLKSFGTQFVAERSVRCTGARRDDWMDTIPSAPAIGLGACRIKRQVAGGLWALLTEQPLNRRNCVAVKHSA